MDEDEDRAHADNEGDEGTNIPLEDLARSIQRDPSEQKQTESAESESSSNEALDRILRPADSDTPSRSEARLHPEQEPHHIEESSQPSNFSKDEPGQPEETTVDPGGETPGEQDHP
ncbi:MAG: hypothetical protein ABEI52_01815, partial [Halobacteriaceae archaeon]